MEFNLEIYDPNGECVAVHQYDPFQVQGFTGMAMYDIADLQRMTVVFKDKSSYHLVRLEGKS